MTVFTQTFEGGTNGTGITAANSGTAGNTAFSANATLSGSTTIQYSTAAAFHGSLGMAIAFTGAGAGYIPWTIAPTDANTRVAVRFYVTPPTGTTTHPLMYFRNASANAGQVNIDSSGRFQILGTAATLATSTSVLTGGTTYRVEAAITPGTSTTAGTFEINVYVGDGAIQFWTATASSANLGSAVLTSLRFGASSNPAARTIYYDDLAADTALASGFIGSSGSPSYSATPSLSGSGGLTSVGGLLAADSRALAGTGSLGALGVPGALGTVGLSGAGGLGTAGPLAAAGSSPGLSGTGSLTAPAGAASVGDAASLSGAGALGTDGSSLNLVTPDLSGTGGLGIASTIAASGSAGFGGGGSLSAPTRTPLATGGAGLSGAGGLGTTLRKPVVGTTAALAGGGGLGMIGSRTYLAPAVLGGAGTLAPAAVARMLATAGFSAAGALSVVGTPRHDIVLTVLGAATGRTDFVPASLVGNPLSVRGSF